MPAKASTPVENTIRLEDMTWEWVDMADIAYEEAIMPLTTGSMSKRIPQYTTYTLSPPLSLQADDTLTFNCSYSPSSANLDFGVITSENIFYYISVKGGRIDQQIRISQSGSYSVAVRNNSSQTVSVVGFVNY